MSDTAGANGQPAPQPAPQPQPQPSAPPRDYWNPATGLGPAKK